jgi:AraC-like DNA-binding protein
MAHDLSADHPIVYRRRVAGKGPASFYDVHYAMEVCVIRSGSMRREYSAWADRFGRGDVSLCGMWEPHGYCEVIEPCELSAMLIDPEWIVRRSTAEANFFTLFAMAPQDRPRLDADGRRRAGELADRIEGLHADDHRRREPWQETLLTELLLMLLDAVGPGPGPGSDGDPRDYLRIQPAIELVFRENRLVPVTEAARACNLSRSHFDETFRGVMGTTFARFALRHRLQGAAHQLRTSDDPVKKVAIDWGFTDSSHLHTTMVRWLGQTPGQIQADGAPDRKQT